MKAIRYCTLMAIATLTFNCFGAGLGNAEVNLRRAFDQIRSVHMDGVMTSQNLSYDDYQINFKNNCRVSIKFRTSDNTYNDYSTTLYVNLKNISSVGSSTQGWVFLYSHEKTIRQDTYGLKANRKENLKEMTREAAIKVNSQNLKPLSNAFSKLSDLCKSNG